MQPPRGRKRRSGCQFGADSKRRIAAALSFAWKDKQEEKVDARLQKPGQTKGISEGERKTNPEAVSAVLRLR